MLGLGPPEDCLQADLGDIEGLVPNHCKKASTTIQQLVISLLVESFYLQSVKCTSVKHNKAKVNETRYAYTYALKHCENLDLVHTVNASG